MLQQISFHYVGVLVSVGLPFIADCVYSIPTGTGTYLLYKSGSVIFDTQFLAVRKVKIFTSVPTFISCET